MALLEPKTVEIKDGNGKMHSFMLSKFPAIQGREIITQYPVTASPKIGEYKANEALMLKLMAFVGVDLPGGMVRLETMALIENHVPDFECLMRLEWAMLEYNCSFFRNGEALTFLKGFAREVTGLASKTLTASLAQLSQPAKPH